MGFIIIFEGIDGSGKSTVSSAVFEKLKKDGVNVCLLRKKDVDYDSDYIRMLMGHFKNILWNEELGNPVYEVTDQGWLFLHAAWYKIMAENLIFKRQLKYDIVILDGWYYKIMCRFLAKDKFDNLLVNKVFESLPRGDMVFLLKANPLECFMRKSNFTDAEIGENERISGTTKDRFIRFQENVQNQYSELAKNNNWYTVNVSEKAIDVIAEEILNVIKNDLGSILC